MAKPNQLNWKQKFVDNAHQCFAFTPQAIFPAHDLNFHWRWRWWDWIQAILLNLFYFNFLRNMKLNLRGGSGFSDSIVSFDGNFFSCSNFGVWILILKDNLIIIIAK